MNTAAALHPKPLLAAQGTAPKHSFGQNFLVDLVHVERIASLVRACCRDPQNRVVEFGAGTGNLTDALLRLGLTVHAVERDRDLLPILRTRFADALAEGRLFLYEDNALTVPLDGKGLDAGGVLCGNLPYHLSSQLCLRAIEYSETIGGAVFLVQAEMGERIAATPNHKDYGSLSVLLQAFFTVENAHFIPAGAFWPVPAVDGVVVAMHTTGEPAPARTCQLPWKAVEKVIRPAFQQRRKTLHNALQSLPEAIALLPQAGISAKLRAEQVAVADFVRLAHLLFQEQICQKDPK